MPPPGNKEPAYRYTCEQTEAATGGYLDIIQDDRGGFKTNLPIYMSSPVTRYMTVDAFYVERNYRQEFVVLNLEPRINEMYYTDGKDRCQMSIYGVLRYFHLTERKILWASFDEPGLDLWRQM